MSVDPTAGEPTAMGPTAVESLDAPRAVAATDVLPTAGPPKAKGAGLGHVVARGTSFGVAATLVNRLLSLVLQFALARLLSEEAFGLIAQANTLSVIAVIFSIGGLQEVLTQRSRRFRLWARPAFWMSVIGGIFTALILAASAPFAARWFHEPRVAPLVLLTAAGIPFGAALPIYLAQASAQMRFKLIAASTVFQVLAQTISTVIFAFMMRSATAVVLGSLVSSIATLAFLAVTTPVHPGFHPRLRRWKYLVTDVGWIYFGRCAFWASALFDVAVMGRLYDNKITGRYYFALALAMQPARMIYTALQSVVFPSLATIADDPRRQIDTFLRGAQLVAVVIVPLSAVQLVLAEPLILTLFGAKWAATIGTFQVLSVAAAIYSVGLLNSGLVLAQARNAAWCVQQFIGLAAMVFVIPGALMRQEFGVAVAVCIAQAITAVSFHLIAIRGHIREFGGRIVGFYVRSYLLAAACAGVCYAIDRGVLSAGGGGIVRILAAGVTFPAYYLALLRLIAPDVLTELWARFRPLIGR